MIRSVLLSVILIASSVAVCAEDKPLTEEQKKRVEELKKEISAKRAEIDKLDAELAKLSTAKWPGLNEWVRVGDVQVRLTKCKLQKVPLLQEAFGRGDPIRRESEDPELMFWAEIENLSKVKKIAYSRWTSQWGSNSPVTDEHENTYRISNYSGGGFHPRIEGALSGGFQDMRPGDPVITDIVSVERPVDAATEVRLELRSVQPGESGKFHFRIPASAWKGNNK